MSGLTQVTLALTPMVDPFPNPSSKNPHNLSAEKYARLKAEAAAPYRGLRKFIYGAIAASGLLGGFIFLTQLLAGRALETTLPNLGVQVGVVALMVLLFRLEGQDKPK